VEEPFTLESFVALHPWEQDYLARGRPLEWLWPIDVVAQPDEVWRVLIETSRFNRALGLSRMEFEERDGVLHGTGTNGGVRQVWVEVPWDWVSERWLVARREYSKGFAHVVRVIYRLQRLDRERIRVWIYFGWIPRGLIGKLALKVGMPSVERGFRKLLVEMVEAGRGGDPGPFFVPPPQLAPAAVGRLRAARDALVARGVAAPVVDVLLDHVRAGDDMDVYRIQLRKLARQRGVDAEELLRAALHATRLGVLDMSWDVICPHCRGVREQARTLGDVPERGDCDVCGIDFTTGGERSLEITFHVHPSIRDVPRLYFCSAEPSTKTHIELQQRLAVGERRRLDTGLPPGRYRLHLRGVQEYGYVDIAEGAEVCSLAWPASSSPPSSSSVVVGPAVELVNDTTEMQAFLIEDVTWADEALRPVDLFNLQEFRDLFSDEYVASDVQLSVGEQTILFTDIVGSTRFYATRGDPEAFMQVKRHFTEVFEVVRRHHGAVVKTIGDAAMAAFSSPVDALRAARDIHACFPAGREDTPVRVRASINTGPCIAVRLNSNIDYFGNTVNTAAKLQGCVGAGQIAFSEATRRAAGVDQLLADEGVVPELVELDLAALGGKIAVHRWDTNPAAAPPRQAAGEGQLR